MDTIAGTNSETSKDGEGTAEENVVPPVTVRDETPQDSTNNSTPKEEEKTDAGDTTQPTATSTTTEDVASKPSTEDATPTSETPKEAPPQVTAAEKDDDDDEEGEVVEDGEVVEAATSSTNAQPKEEEDNNNGTTPTDAAKDTAAEIKKDDPMEVEKTEENSNDSDTKGNDNDDENNGIVVAPEEPTENQENTVQNDTTVTVDAATSVEGENVKEEEEEGEVKDEKMEDEHKVSNMEEEGGGGGDDDDEEEEEEEGEVKEETMEEAAEAQDEEEDAAVDDKDDQTEDEEEEEEGEEGGSKSSEKYEQEVAATSMGDDADKMVEGEKSSQEEGEVVEEVEEGREIEEDEEEKDIMPYSTRGRQQQQKEADGEAVARGGSEFDRPSFRDNTSEQDVDSELGMSGRSSAVEPETATGSGGGGGSSAARSGAAALSSTSFLEALTEEERRTRTRFLPEVEGIRMLYKHEVRSDLGLARSIVSSGGVPGTLKKSSRGRKPKHQQQHDDDKMDLDEDDSMAQSEDGASDTSSRHSSKIEFTNKDFVTPCNAFVAPPESSTGSINGDSASTSSSTIGASSKHILVESITAFNPPRNPESIGPKKKHRMMRWEQQPQDVEVDLNKYRKTVKKTREELHREERERERIEVVGSILRTHCLNHLDALADESQQLNEELSTIQTKCVKAADLLTSRTRSRGAGKGGYVMRDTLSVLKTRSANLKVSLPVKAQQEKIGSIPKGLGGVSAISFKDWDRSTANIEPVPLAEAWILPGDKVQTPYGDGVAVHVFGPSVLDVNSSPLDELRPKPAPKAPSGNNTAVGNSMSGMIGGMGMNGGVQPMNISETTSAGSMTLKNGKPKQTDCLKKGTNELQQILAPRICVRLSFGLGFFAADQVTSKEDPSSYSDSMLAARWKKMVETSELVGSCVDIAGMEFASGKGEMDLDDGSGSGSKSVADSDRMDDVDNHDDLAVNDGGDAMQEEVNSSSGGQKSSTSQGIIDEKKAAGKRLFPFGSGMLPTACGRGALYPHAEITALETGMHSCLFDGGGVLGTKDNRGVPEGAREWEDQRYDTIQLQAKIRQLRNELNRQRRIRLLNERTLSTVKDRSHRVENLVKEMKSDLKNLKDRLQDEVTDLGIEEDKAQKLLSAVYTEQDKVGDSALGIPPPKRKRKAVTKEVAPVVPKNTRSRASDLQEGSEDPDTALGEDTEEHRAGGEHDSRMSAEDDTGADTSDPETGDEDRRAKRSRLAAQ